MVARQTTAIDQALEKDEQEALSRQAEEGGPVAKLVAKFATTNDNLLGFILEMSYEEATIVTCDAWKRKCGGLPKNSFVVIRLNPKVAALAPIEQPKPSLILARITESAVTPVSQEVQQTIFEIHKIQAIPDPYTDAELQWGAVKAAILGTYYDRDDRDAEGVGPIAFGNDIDSYISPHFYEVYVPEPADLELLINSFVSTANPVEIGVLRYTETRTAPGRQPIKVRVAPADFIANRTALFGKTRSGKSNTIKLIADMVMRSGEDVGQIIFDLAAEYAYPNDQDKTSLFSLHQSRCVRYSLNPDAHDDGHGAPLPLKVNFLEQVTLGHTIITSLWDTVNQTRPKYFLPLLEMWEPCDTAQLAERFPDAEARGELVRYQRAQSMYFAALAKAGFEMPRGFAVKLHLHRALREELAKDQRLQNPAFLESTQSGTKPAFSSSPLFGPEDSQGQLTESLDSSASADAHEEDGTGDVKDSGKRPPAINDEMPVQNALQAYERLHMLWTAKSTDVRLFPVSKTSGKPYLEEVHSALLKIIGDKNVSGTKYLIDFADYHSLNGSHLTDNIVQYVNAGKTVIIDLANADEEVARYYSKLITTAVFAAQVKKFTRRAFGKHSVLFYFEEAHNLFERDDKNLRSVYNRLAKEGAKYQIGLVYGTQSMTTLSPDLLKNTENFFITHLNDDREIRELTRHYEFRDVGPDVQRSKARGYVRMITLSHRYALPVQIHKFGPMVQS